jgi:hypothetical protein
MVYATNRPDEPTADSNGSGSNGPGYGMAVIGAIMGTWRSWDLSVRMAENRRGRTCQALLPVARKRFEQPFDQNGY